MSNIIDSIQLSGTVYTIQGSGGGGNPTVELTQAEYDALVTAGTVSADTYYIITDATAGDLTQYWTSAQTQSAITEATSGNASQSDLETVSGDVQTVSGQVANKQDTLVSGTNIKTINNESILGSGNITIQGGGGGGTVESAITSASTNAVESSAIYDATHVDSITLWTPTNSNSYQPQTTTCYKFCIQYTGDTVLDEEVSIMIWYGSSHTLETLSGNVYQESATTSSVFTSTFEDGKWIIESSSPNYVRQLYVSNYDYRIWLFKRNLGGGFAADSIKDDIIPYISNVETVANNAIVSGSFTQGDNKKEIAINLQRGNGGSASSFLKLDDLKYTQHVLSTDIQIPTGEVGWMDFTPTSNCLAGDIPTNKVKVTYSGQTVSAQYRTIYFNAIFRITPTSYQEYRTWINWTDTTTPTANGCSAVTATYDSTDDSVIIELPSGETTYDGNTGTFSIKNFRSDSCQFGTGISSVKCYGDITEDIYTVIAHKQDTLSAGTGISIVDNVISATGGGGGGGKAIEAGRGIAITTGATADTVSFNLPISAETGTSGTYIAIGVNAYAQEGYKSFLSNAGGISIGSGSSANRNSIIIGNGAADDKNRGHGISIGTGAKSKYGSISIGEFSESSGTTDEKESSIAIGYNTTAKNVIKALAIGTDVRTTGTTKTNINNQLTIDTSNQVYISNSANTSTYCLQEKIENTEAALGGLKLVKLTQSEYDALSPNYDNNTIYFIKD